MKFWSFEKFQLEDVIGSEPGNLCILVITIVCPVEVWSVTNSYYLSYLVVLAMAWSSEGSWNCCERVWLFLVTRLWAMLINDLHLILFKSFSDYISLLFRNLSWLTRQVKIVQNLLSVKSESERHPTCFRTSLDFF